MRLAEILRRIVLERAIGSAFEILELARVERPEKGEQAKRAKEQRRWDEPGERGHDFGPPASRAAFSVTRIDEVDITIAAISGVT